MGLIYHIADTADWQRAQQGGEYRTSTRGQSLEQQGFIHASTADQVAPVANAIYAGAPGLLVLVIDEDRVEPEIVYEPVPGWNTPFPHIYGPLDVDAVVETLPLVPDASGRLTFTTKQESEE